MKKQEKKVTADEMYDAAERRTEESRDDGLYEREDAWKKLIGSYHGEKNDYAEKGVFMDARDYFAARERDIHKGWYATHHFLIRREVKKILSFNFNFDYDSFSWNEQTYDLEDDSAFDYCSESDELPYAKLKREVTVCLRSFLLTGAVLAKKIGSDTYVRWRKLITDFDYVYNAFEHGAKPEEVEAFVKSMDEAAELYTIDAEVSARLDLTERPAKRKIAPK